MTEPAWSQAPVRALAYMGDAVYEMHVRERTLRAAAAQVDALHRATVRHVSAHGQAAIAQLMLPRLTEEEADVFRRARNHKGGGRKPDMAAYKLSTAFEAVLGYLYLKPDRPRLQELLALADQMTNELKENEDAQ